MQPFLAMITPISSDTPPGNPPPLGIWGGSNQPFPGWGLPGIPPGMPPLGIWGGSNQPFPGWGLPGGGTPPGMPPGIWGGSNQPFPGWGLPGGGTPPGMPPGIWGGSNEPFPGWGLPPVDFTPPEHLPEVPANKALVLLYTADDGWRVAIITKPGPGYNPPPGGAVNPHNASR